MDLAEIFRVMRGRWYVLLPGLLSTAGLMVAVSLLVPVTYQSQSTVMLLNSEKATVAYDGNPFLSTQTSLTGMADGLARNLNSDSSVRELEDRGAVGVFEAKLADNAQGPMMWLTVTGTDEKAVPASVRTLTAYAEERLERFQEQQTVAPKAMIRMTTIVAPQDPVAQTKTRLEYLVMAGGLGLVLSLVAVFYAEARHRAHAPRRPERAAEPDSAREAGEPVVEQTTALRRPPAWSRATEDRTPAGPGAGRMAVGPAAEPPEEEPSHEQRSPTGQRNR